jgi:hypothetical protein
MRAGGYTGMNLSLLEKIRCRFLDRSTGTPVSGVTASLSVLIGDPPNNTVQLPVATLCTDAAGYMAFDLKPLMDIELGAVAGFFISATKFGLVDYDLLGSLVAAPHGGAGNKNADASAATASAIAKMMPPAASNGRRKKLPCIVFPIYLENRLQNGHPSESASCEPMRLPSIQSPDICDYQISPFSFVTPAALKLGNDCCETLLPSSLPIQRHRFYKVIMRRERITSTDDIEVPIADTSLTSRVKVMGTLESTLESRLPDIKFGEILEYQQEWYSLGHSLGEIKYSLPLAPGESTQLAVIDWSRDDLASRTDKIRATEFLDHDSRRDRAIDETVEAALKEEQGGNSFMGSTAGTASGQTYGSGTWTGNHAVGYGISYSYGKRNLEADSLQDLHDRVRQASSSVRSLNSTVIVQASQTEKSTLQTRRVANHNHCHAVTIQYYEVLRHYRLSTAFAGLRNAVLIPFEPFSFDIGKDDWKNALRFRTVLEQALLDPSLGKCFEAVLRLKLSPSAYDAPEPKGQSSTGAAPPIAEVENKMTLKGSEGKGKELQIKSLKKGDNIKISASGLLAMAGGNGRGSAGVSPNGTGQLGTRGNFPYLADPDVLQEFSLIYKIGYTDSWHQGSEQFEINAGKDGDFTIIFGVNNLPNGFADFGVVGAESWTIAYKYPSRGTEPTPADPEKTDAAREMPFRKSDDELCSARLLNHLQNNQGYYNSAVWMLMDAVERRLYLEQALQDRPDILDGMDDKPLAISGHYVAFPYSGPLAQWQDSSDELPTAPIEDIVTLPTRGLFAEAQMGHCNSCEKRDVTRMWDWTEMTAETPPDISGISPGPKGQLPSITPGQLPTNVIQITTPQAAPDPTGLANALSVLKTPNIFRDMAGLDDVSKLLGEMVKDATDANTKAMATQAQVKIAEIQAEARNNAGRDGGGASQKQTPAELYDNLQVAKEVAKSAEEFGWDDARVGDLTSNIVSGRGGGFYSDIRGIVEDAIKGANPASDLNAMKAQLSIAEAVIKVDSSKLGACSKKYLNAMRENVEASKLLGTGIVAGAIIAWIPKDLEDVVIGPAHTVEGIGEVVEAAIAIPTVLKGILRKQAQLAYLTCKSLTLDEQNFWSNMDRLLI